MDKQALIEYTEKKVIATDGTYFLIEPKDFLKALLIEGYRGLDIIRPHSSVQIQNLKWWKERLMIMTENRYKLHKDLRVVLMKDATCDGFIFNAFLFYDIPLAKMYTIRSVLNEVGRGFYMNYEQLLLKKEAINQPYFVRLMDVKEKDSTKGIFVLRNFY